MMLPLRATTASGIEELSAAVHDWWVDIDCVALSNTTVLRLASLVTVEDDPGTGWVSVANLEWDTGRQRLVLSSHMDARGVVQVDQLDVELRDVGE